MRCLQCPLSRRKALCTSFLRHIVLYSESLTDQARSQYTLQQQTKRGTRPHASQQDLPDDGTRQLSLGQQVRKPCAEEVSSSSVYDALCICMHHVFDLKLRAVLAKYCVKTRQQGKAGKLYCCFVDFKLSTLYLVLCCGSCCKNLVSVVGSWVSSRTRQRSSMVIATLFCHLHMPDGRHHHGYGCPSSPTLFGLYVEGLEWHPPETADSDAPTLRGD